MYDVRSKMLNSKRMKIMKKIYKSPEMDVIEIKNEQMLLAGSTPSLGSEYSGGDVLAPESDFDFK